MSNAVENEIVSMQFQNRQFEQGVKTTLSTLDRLKASLKFPDSNSGLNNISNNVRGFNMNPLTNAAGEVGKAFSTMSVIAVSAIATIASKATTAGLGVAKSLTISPISQGFSEYETQMGSIQTILANTGLEGQKGLDKVNGALQELNEYSDQTIYNFTEMAKNIGTFTAAGVDLDTSAGAIKGIANLAAVSGSTSEQASTAMYQLSQALASGKVSLMDWNSVVNAGLGGKVFKDALTETARQQGIDVDAMIAKNGSFRDSLQEGWITGTVLTDTLAKFTGDLSKEQLLQQGYTEKQAAEIMKMGQMASDAATKVKTLSQLMDTLKEAVASGWARTFQLIFGDFNQAKKAFTSASTAIGGLISVSSENRNNMLKDWAALNGRTILIQSIKHAWEALGSVLGPVQEAFRQVFPATTGKELKKILVAVNQFFKALILTESAQENLKRTFAGLFAVLHIGLTIFGGIAKILAKVIGLFFQGQGSTLAFTGGIGDMLVALDNFLTKGNVLTNIFKVIEDAIIGVVDPLLLAKAAIVGIFAAIVTGDPSGAFEALRDTISSLLELLDNASDGVANVVNTISSKLGGLGSISGFNLSGMFEGASSAGATKSIDAIEGSLGSIGSQTDRISNAWSKVVDYFSQSKNILDPIKEQFNQIGTTISGAFSDIGNFFQPVLDSFSGIGPLISEAFSGGLANISFDQVAEAINLTVLLLIFQQFKKFSNAITGIAESASGVLDQVTGNLKSMQADVRADVILKIAGALALLAAAIFLISQTNPDRLGTSLGAVAGMLALLVAAMITLEKTVTGFGGGAKLAAVSVGLVLMAAAIAAMAGAVYLFSLMDKDEMTRGLIGVSSALAVLTASAAIMAKSGAGANMIGASIGLLIMSAALLALLKTIEVFAKIDGDTLASGLLKIAGTLAVLVVAMNFMKLGVGGAAAMVIVSYGLLVLADALKEFAEIPFGEFLKAITMVAISLGVLVVAMALMSGGLVGAGALLLIVASLTLLVPIIIALGNLPWEVAALGIGILVGAMLALALAAFAISPVIPVILALAQAVFLLGAAVFLVGAGIALFGIGLAALAAKGKDGFGVLIDIIDAFLDKLPEMISKFGDTVSAIADLIRDKAPEMIDALTTLVDSMLDSAIKLMPKFGKFLTTMITVGISIVENMAGDLAEAGIRLLLRFIAALDANIDAIVDTATNLIIKFVNALSRNGVKLAEAGLDALIDFLNGLANAIRTRSQELNAAGIDVAKAIIGGVKDGISQAAGEVFSALKSLLTDAVSKLPNPASLVGKIVGRSSGLTGVYAELVGGTDQVTEALTKIKDQIKDTFTNAKDRVGELNDKLEDLQKAKVKKPKLIKETKQLIKDTEALKDSAKNADDAYKQQLKNNLSQFNALAAKYDETVEKIKNADDALKLAQSKQEEFKDSILSTFGAVPDIQAKQSLASYMRDIAKQQVKVDKFNATLAALRAAGLDEDEYRRFLAEGLDAQTLMDQLLASGPEAITAFEGANDSLAASTGALANVASSVLGYDKAVTAAQQYLSGLRDELGNPDSILAIRRQMENLALQMMNALQAQFSAAAPAASKPKPNGSKKNGKDLVEEFVGGMDSMRSDVVQASSSLAITAWDTLQSTLARVGNGLSSDISMSPVITPVLDLTQLAKDASNISGLLNVPPISAGVSFAQASDISAGRAPTDDDGSDGSDGSGGNTYLDVTQNITAPEALDNITLYRQTKNIASLIRAGLDK